MTNTRHVARSDGGSIALHHIGGDGAEPLLVSHATGFHGRCYRDLARSLSPRWTVWALDYSGHGESQRAERPLTNWEPFAHDALAVSEEIAPDGGLVAFGHSMGGAAVLLAHLIDPTRFSRLVAFEPIAPPPTPSLNVDELPIAVGAERRRPGFESKAAALANYGSKPPLSGFTSQSLSDYVEFGMEETEGGALLRCTPNYEASVFRSAHTNSLWERLVDIDLPTDVIVGRIDDNQPAAFAGGIADRLPRGHLHEFPDMDHFGPFASPAQCAELIDALLAG